MTWRAFQVILRLRSPLHIGCGKVGNLQRTRPYVTGRVLWGALTMRLTRDAFQGRGGATDSSQYREIGDQVHRDLAFTYLYPALKSDAGYQVVWPWEHESVFRRRFLSSYQGTALSYPQQSAAEGMLHEVEFISPNTLDTGEIVFLKGCVFEKQGCTLNWQTALNRLQLGGERGYGWGRVSLYELGDPIEGEINLFNRWVVDLRQQEAVITVPKDELLLAHTCCDNLQAHGQIEPWLGRETLNPEQYGAKLSQAKVCWVPGSRVADESRLTIGRYGLWEALSPSNSNSAKIPGDRRRD
jgi:hypothetical protein